MKPIHFLKRAAKFAFLLGFTFTAFKHFKKNAFSASLSEKDYESALRYISINVAIDRKQKEKDLIKKTWFAFEAEQNNSEENYKIGKERPKDALRLASFNLNRMRDINGRNSGMEILGAIEKIGADVLALQECVLPDGDYGMNFFTEMSKMGYKHVVYHRDTFSKELDCSCGNVIFSKIKVQKSAIIELEFSGRNAVVAQFSVPSYEKGEMKEIAFSLASVRLLKPPSLQLKKLLEQKQSEDDKQTQEKETENSASDLYKQLKVDKQLQLLTSKLSQNNFENLILAGSFNALSPILYNHSNSFFHLKKFILLSSKKHKTQLKEMKLVLGNLPPTQQQQQQKKQQPQQKQQQQQQQQLQQPQQQPQQQPRFFLFQNKKENEKNEENERNSSFPEISHLERYSDRGDAFSSSPSSSLNFVVPYTHFSGRTLDYFFVVNSTWRNQLSLRSVFLFHTNCSDHLPLLIDLVSSN